MFELWSGLAVCHAVTRSVRDNAALLDASAGPALGDAYWAPPPRGPFSQEVGKAPGKLKMALVLVTNPEVEIDPECCRAAENAAQMCCGLGHEVDEVTQLFQNVFPWMQLLDAGWTIIGANVAAWVNGRLAVLKRDLRDGDLEPAVRQSMETGRKLTAEEMVKARMVIHRTQPADGRVPTGSWL